MIGPVTYSIVFDVRPGKRDEFLSLLGQVLDAMRHEATFVEAVLHDDPGAENRFMLYETWTSHQNVIKVQLQRPYRNRYHAALPDLLASERAVSTWQPMRSDRAIGPVEQTVNRVAEQIGDVA